MDFFALLCGVEHDDDLLGAPGERISYVLNAVVKLEVLFCECLPLFIRRGVVVECLELKAEVDEAAVVEVVLLGLVHVEHLGGVVFTSTISTSGRMA